MKNVMYRSELVLDESGISVAPPPRPRLATPALLPAPSSATLPSSHTRQRRPDAPSSTSENLKMARDTESKSSNKTNTETETSGNESTTSSSNDNEEHQVDDNDEVQADDKHNTDNDECKDFFFGFLSSL